MRNNSATANHTDTINLHSEIAVMQRRLGELIQLATRAPVVQLAPPPKPDTRDTILAQLKSKGSIPLETLQTDLGLSKSMAHHHVNTLAREGRVVIVKLPTTGGRLHNVVYHADAIAI